MEPIPLASLLGGSSATRPGANSTALCSTGSITQLMSWPRIRWSGRAGTVGAAQRTTSTGSSSSPLAQDRHDPTLWLFGGIFEVLARAGIRGERSYTVTLREDLMGPFIRRLFVRLMLTGRQRQRTMETCLDAMTVASILPEPHLGDPFPGHDRINHSLADLQRIISQNRPDWRIALENMKGVYVIHDRLTGQPYVGSAYGDTGIWQRWSHYAETIHGDNVGPRGLVERRGADYARENLVFALLEFWSMRTEDQHVLNREAYWKQVAALPVPRPQQELARVCVCQCSGGATSFGSVRDGRRDCGRCR